VSRVIIIGAGIARMPAAIGLRLLKIETSIIEQATELAEVGSGISLAQCLESVDEPAN
jgi:2-polyprenyl-6-methoxyphenol hydroxylase-like FAD-dependent oxidoreductase